MEGRRAQLSPRWLPPSLGVCERAGSSGTGNWARTRLPALTGSRLVLRELQEREREKALRLQKEQLQRELEEKKKKVKESGPGAPVGSLPSSGPTWGSPAQQMPRLPGCVGLAWGRGRGHAACTRLARSVSDTGLHAPQEEEQRLAEERLQEEQQRKARAAVAAASKGLNVTVDVQVRPGTRVERLWSLVLPFPVAGGTDYVLGPEEGGRIQVAQLFLPLSYS